VAAKRPIRRTRRGDYEVRLSREERDTLRALPGELRDLLEMEDPSSDPAVARLHPPAYPDDPLMNLEYEMGAGAGLGPGRLEAVATMEATIDADRLTEDELTAWMSVVNDLRLVLGTRLDVTEDTTPADFPADDPRSPVFALYAYATWLVDTIVGALSRQTGIGPPPAE